MRLLALLAIFCVGACQRTERSSATADCARVADMLTSFETGNQVPPDKRAAVVAKHKASCESAQVTADEAACVGRATDTWTARACLPRMFPPSAAKEVGAAGCVILTSRMRAAVMADVGSNGSAASAQLDKLLPVIQASCEQDKWPANIIQCVNDTKPGDMTGFQSCTNQLSPELQNKMAGRLSAALQAEPPPPAPPAPPK